MDIHLIIAQYKGCPLPNFMPNVIDAWDEFTLEDNWSGFAEAVEKAEASDNYEKVRTLIVNIPDDAVVNLFKTPSVKGRVES